MSGERNLRLLIEYDGTLYHGWQSQPGLPTVQATIEAGLKQLLQQEITVTGAGRTDAGVHARGQVASVRTSSELPLGAILRGVNALTPGDIVVRAVDEAPASFHARFDARRRNYRYRIGLNRCAIGRMYRWDLTRGIDIHRMQASTACLAGTRDFSAFALSGDGDRSHECTLYECEWHSSGDEIQLHIAADRFLRGMVRAIVGTSVKIGLDRWPVERMKEVLRSGDRSSAGPTAPARGLCLMSVEYE